jgi:hypothetical protein
MGLGIMYHSYVILGIIINELGYRLNSSISDSADIFLLKDHSDHLVLVKTEGVLGLVEDRLAGAAVNVLVLGATKLISSGLSAGLLAVGNDTTGNLVAGIGEGLLELLSGGLGGVWLKALLGLGGEIFASKVRHVDV